MPGIRRKRAGTRLQLRRARRPQRSRDRKRRSRASGALAIPPAYTDVWICPRPNGHIQATGRDARGRKQYRYHPKWREVRDETKFGRMLAFSERCRRSARAGGEDLATPGLPREKVLATVVRLLECTGIRVGNDEYARANRSFGLTTLQDRHVEISGSKLRFEFRGKSGKTHDVVAHRPAAGADRGALPGGAGRRRCSSTSTTTASGRPIGSGDVNDYLREITGAGLHRQGLPHLGGHPAGRGRAPGAGAGGHAARGASRRPPGHRQVAEQLNNTRAVCRKYYVHPAVLETYLAGTMLQALENGNAKAAAEAAAGLREEEQAVVRLLTRQVKAAAQ